jgi:hypothetical protein
MDEGKTTNGDRATFSSLYIKIQRSYFEISKKSETKSSM